MTKFIRYMVNKLLADYKKKKLLNSKDVTTYKLLAVAGVCKGGPGDLADEHDKYLYCS